MIFSAVRMKSSDCANSCAAASTTEGSLLLDNGWRGSLRSQGRHVRRSKLPNGEMPSCQMGTLRMDGITCGPDGRARTHLARLELADGDAQQVRRNDHRLLGVRQMEGVGGRPMRHVCAQPRTSMLSADVSAARQPTNPSAHQPISPPPATCHTPRAMSPAQSRKSSCRRLPSACRPFPRHS